jgi:hypothetical protein
VAEFVLDPPAPADPGGELDAGGLSGPEVGDQVDALDGELAGGQVSSPAVGLASVGVVDVVGAEVAPGQAVEPVVESGLVGLDHRDALGVVVLERSRHRR